MAKVTGPLFSLTASGAIGKAMVHFGWKGRNVVRQWLIPTNPRADDQKAQRQIMGVTGKNVAAVALPSAALAGGSKLYKLLVAAAPAGQTWNSTFGKHVLEDLSNPTNFANLSTAIFGADMIATWRAQGGALGFATQATGDTYKAAIAPELQLAMGAYAAYKLNLSSTTDIYSTYPSNWATDVIIDYACDYVNA